MTKSRSHAEAKIESFRNDPLYAAEYLSAVMENGDHEEILETLHYMAHISPFAHFETHLFGKQPYRLPIAVQ